MKPFRIVLMLIAVLLLADTGNGWAKDMRASHTQARLRKAELLEATEAKRLEAQKEAEASRRRILQDRQALAAAMDKVRRQNAALETESHRLTGQIAALEKRRTELQIKVAEAEAEVKETVGFVRANAKDLMTLLDMSPQSAWIPDRGKALRPIIDQTAYPGIEHIRSIADLLFDEIRRSGEVHIRKGPIIDRNGVERSADILILGNFTASYRSDNETGFLLYSNKSRRMFALSKLPPRVLARKIVAYMAGQSDDVPLDITRGAALRQLTHRLSLLEQVPEGGPIVWPILGIGAIAMLIVLERLSFLFRKTVNADRFMGIVCSHIDREEWDECLSFCNAKQNKPIPRIMMTGIRCREMNRQDLENALQEAILNEIPRLERFMSTLGMLAAIAPLLGLLGTVTGMINTFHAITFFGTGNPRLMSGGISEALVTTMIGLSVAIPVMLAHTLLSRRVENLIATMEEKAVSLVNRLFTARNGS